MPQADPTRLDLVEATLNYLAPGVECPEYYLYNPPAGTSAAPANEKRTVPIHDARVLPGALTLDRNGCALIEAPDAPAAVFDDDLVRASYYPACAEAVRRHTGAVTAHAFDHNVRNKELAKSPDSGVRDPVRFAHNDYTEISAPQRVRDLFGDLAERLLAGRYVFINLWRPLAGPVLDVPLAVCDAASIRPDDFVATALRYADRTGEVYSLRYNPAHRWYYFDRMATHEALLLKCFDSARDGRARFTAHSAFRDPRAAADVPPRFSIEVRTVAFFA